MNRWPPWLGALIWTVATVAGSYLVGYLLRAIVGPRLQKLAARTSSDWDDIVLAALKRRIPFWSLLIGLYLSLAYWPLTAAAYTLAARVLSAIGVASVTLALASVGTQFAVSYGSRGSMPVSGLTQNVIRIVVTILGALVIIRSFGYDITPMLTVLGVGGLTVALALQEPLSNLFAGLFVSIGGQINIGDYVRLDSGAEGYVVDFNWRSTRLKQLGDNVIEVPNSKLSQAVVTNFSIPTPEMGFGVDVVVDVESDLMKVERIALEVAGEVLREVQGAVREAQPSVRFSAFAETGIKCSVGVRIRTFTDQFLVRHELIKRLQRRFEQEGIELADVRMARTRRSGRP